MAMVVTAALFLFLRRSVLSLSETLTKTQVHTATHQTFLPVSLETLGDLHVVTATSRRKLWRKESCLYFSIMSLLHLTTSRNLRHQNHRQVETELKCNPESLTRKGEKPQFSSAKVRSQL